MYQTVYILKIVISHWRNKMIQGKSRFKKCISVGIGFMLFTFISIGIWGIENARYNDEEIYIRYLTPQDLELEPPITYDSAKFLKALESNDNKSIYIAINRLVETFNDPSERQKALEAIQPFMQDANEKIREAAKFAVAILSGTFQSELIYELADGSVVFTLFNDYSAYGSQNVIWRIKDNVLEEYTSFYRPSMYIKSIIPSPDKKLFAVVTVSNKSEFVNIVDAPNYRSSPELIESARIQYGEDIGEKVWSRIDHENYATIDTIRWVNDDTLEIESQLPYKSGIEDVVITYHFGENYMKVNPQKSSLNIRIR